MQVRYAIAAVLCCGMGLAVAEESSPFKTRAEQESYAIGAQTARTLRRDKTDIDVEMLVRGIRDGLSANGAAMLLSDKEVRAVMGRVQQEVRKNMVLNRREQGERARVEGAKFLASHAAEPGVVTTASGLQYRIESTGKGPRPVLGDVAQVRYRGTLLSGAEFDASPEDAPAHLVIAQTIAGLKEALQMMPVGSRWTLWVPAPLGYGERGKDAELGPHEVLKFELELVGIDQK